MSAIAEPTPAAAPDAISAVADLHPHAPRTLEEAGLSHELVLQLLLKIMHFGADQTGVELANRVGLEFSAIEPVLEFLKRTHQCEIFGGSMVGAASYRYRITDEGRRRALLFLEHSKYVGVAPVPLSQYRAYMEAYRVAAPRHVTRDAVRRAFSHLVLSQKVLDQVGPAVAAGHSMFVYGPPGNGKTVIAQAIRNLQEGEIAIPHALEVEGQIIKLYDPVNHERLADPASADEGLMLGLRRDARWVRCRRPLVTVGGELSLDALDLSYSPTSKFYQAPVQLTANGGVLVIDDFGRQKCSPIALLNRWITPLETRIDYLTLQTGQKMPIPFAALIVFATNIRPADLVDEAFLRRIPYKIEIIDPTEQEFRDLFKLMCPRLGFEYDDKVVDYLLHGFYKKNKRPLRACQPRDLLLQVKNHCLYQKLPIELKPEYFDLAVENYFAVM